MTEIDVIKCFPGYADGSLKVGDIILPQIVAACFKLSPQQAKFALDEMVGLGYLFYDEGNAMRVAGYHLTELGLNLVK